MKRTIITALLAGIINLALAIPAVYAASSNPCNPCAAENPCNPCAAAKNPCNPCNPCAAKNPCNPCAASGKLDPKLVARPSGTKLQMGSVEGGKKLFNDNKLSSNGLACNTCHNNGAAYANTFSQPYPHKVAMAVAQSGLDSVDVDEMVQLCMVIPMATKPLAWDSSELADLSAYVVEVQKTWKPSAAAGNPCNPCNPCAAKNPCNPCAAKNPCNPCAVKNPCNPCAGASG
jgi:hypothetical protein